MGKSDGFQARIFKQYDSVPKSFLSNLYSVDKKGRTNPPICYNRIVFNVLHLKLKNNLCIYFILLTLEGQFRNFKAFIYTLTGI